MGHQARIRVLGKHISRGAKREPPTQSKYNTPANTLTKTKLNTKIFKGRRHMAEGGLLYLMDVNDEYVLEFFENSCLAWREMDRKFNFAFDQR